MVRLLPDAGLDDEIIGFHAQQAVEKALKAWLVHLGIDFPKVHSLGALMDLLGVHGHPLPHLGCEAAHGRHGRGALIAR